MDIVKKNLISIIFGVIAILAIVGNFYPMGAKREALKTEAGQHAAKYEELRNLINKPRKLPVVMLGATEESPLPGFPTHQALDVARQAVDQVNKASDQLVALASGTLNTHTPLVAGALPGQPGVALPSSRFARYYLSMFPPPAQPGAVLAIEPAPRPSGAPPSLMDILKAKNPPTDLEMTNARNAETARIQAAVTQIDASGQIRNQAEVNDAIQAGLKKLNETMRGQTAKAAKVWVAPDAFSIYTGMSVSVTPDPTDIFWAQIGLWTQEDICHAIFNINNGTSADSNVMNAPVKMLNKINFLNANQPNQPPTPGPIAVFVMPNLQPFTGVGQGGGMNPMSAVPGAGAGGDASAAPPVLDPNAPLDKKTAYSPTGRISNGLFDVEQFEVDLIVDASKVPQVIEGLEAGQYINVIQVENIQTVDSAYYRGGGYFFGDKPCVEIKLRCEELFFRSWLEKYVPARLKTVLGYPTQQPAAPAS